MAAWRGFTGSSLPDIDRLSTYTWRPCSPLEAPVNHLDISFRAANRLKVIPSTKTSILNTWYVTTKGISSTKVCPTLSHQALFRLCSSRRSTPRLPHSRRTSPSLLRMRTTLLSCMATSLHLTFFVTASLTPNRSTLLRSPGRIPDSFFCRPQSLIGQGSKFLGQGKRTSVRLQQCCRRVYDDTRCRHF